MSVRYLIFKIVTLQKIKKIRTQVTNDDIEIRTAIFSKTQYCKIRTNLRNKDVIVALLINENNEARCTKSFFAVKMTISMPVKQKLFQNVVDYETGKNRIFKRTSLHFNVLIAPGFETTLGYCDALSVNTKQVVRRTDPDLASA